MTVRLSIATPVLTMLPSAHGKWEETATIDDVARVAEAADRLGYHHLICSEHIGVPAPEQERRGVTYWDPLATFGYLAARTQHIKLATSVLVLGYHHPLEIAKRYGTLDRISNGRLILGVGVGTLREEFDLLDVPFEDRGARADDAMRALRASLSQREPSYDGTYYSYRGLVVEPYAVQERVPLWVGGRTVRSLRRAVELGDGWCPFAVAPEQAAEWLRNFELPAGFDVVLPPERRLNPIDKREQAADSVRSAVEAGATIVHCSFKHDSLSHYLEQLEALVAIGDALEATA